MRQTVMQPHPVCTCGHLQSQHRMDLQRKACETTGCRCRAWALGGWETVVRLVVEPGEDPDVLGHLQRLQDWCRGLERDLLDAAPMPCACGEHGVLHGQAAMVQGRLHGLRSCEPERGAQRCEAPSPPERTLAARWCQRERGHPGPHHVLGGDGQVAREWGRR